MNGKKKRNPRSLTRKRRMLDIPGFAGASGFHCRYDNFCRSPEYCSPVALPTGGQQPDNTSQFRT